MSVVVTSGTPHACLTATMIFSGGKSSVSRSRTNSRAAALTSSGEPLPSVALLYSFLTHDYSIKYVHHYSDASSPLFYQITAYWGGLDGSILWWAFYGSNELVKFDPIAQKVLKRYVLPSGGGGGAYAVTVDGAGFPWVNELSGNTVVRLDPATEKMQVIKLPTANTGIRKMIVAADGRLWYMGSHSGKIGVIE